MSNEGGKDSTARLAMIGLLILGIGFAYYSHVTTDKLNEHIELTNKHITTLAEAIKNK